MKRDRFLQTNKMFEYYGWIALIYSICEVEDEDEKLEIAVDYAKNLIKKTLPEHHINELRAINGQYMVSLAGVSNHRGFLEEALISFFREIGKKAPGSYGLLYISDDENPEFENEFRVGRLVRGQFEFVKDSHLSPRIPTIEDSC